jgi:hypothetical protein
MSEKPILFSTEMVKAIIEGRKNVTRRVIKPQPLWIADPGIPFKTPDADPRGIIKPPYQPGDRLWVRETWADNIPGCPNGITYKADHIDPKGDGPANPIKWKPSIHMPKAAARIWLEVTNVRGERLREITEEDAIAEGIRIGIGGMPYFSCREAFAALWNSLNAKRGYGWDSNPFVWAISFKTLEGGKLSA